MSRIIIIVLISLIGYLIFNFKTLDTNSLNRVNRNHIYIHELTNFKWDYAHLYVHNIDYQKMVFYKNNQEIFYEIIELDDEGNALPQYLFTDEFQDVTYYKCDFQNGKLIFFKKQGLELNKGFLYFYRPAGCTPHHI